MPQNRGIQSGGSKDAAKVGAEACIVIASAAWAGAYRESVGKRAAGVHGAKGAKVQLVPHRQGHTKAARAKAQYRQGPNHA